MLRASTFRTEAWAMLFVSAVGIVGGGLGTAAVLYERFVAPLDLPVAIPGAWWLWPLIFLLSPLTVCRCVSAFRRGASVARIEKAGVAAWARVQSVKEANWQKGATRRGAVFILDLLVQNADGTTHVATAEDVLPWKIGDALYAHWLPVRLDPQDRSKAVVQWQQANLTGQRAP